MKKMLLFTACSLFLSFAMNAQTNLIQNGKFTDPDDGTKYFHIYEIEGGWASDDTVTNNHGREYNGDNAAAFMHNIAGSIYQVVGDVPSVATEYEVVLLGRVSWNGSTNDVLTLTVKMSSYPGSDATAREIIASIDFELKNPDGGTSEFEEFFGVLNLESNSPKAGENLVFEFDLTKWAANPADDNIWSQIDSVHVFATTATDIKDNSFAHLSIYPVPAHNTINISNGALIENISIIDITGREVMNVINNKPNVVLNVGDLKRGIYFVKVQSNGSSTVTKIILE